MTHRFSIIRRFRARLKRSKLINSRIERSLYRTRFGEFFWLKEGQYLDDCIIRNGYFEKASTALIKRLVKPGSIALDIGANIGYYSILMSKFVGVNGKIIAFEPASTFRKILEDNVVANGSQNVEVIPFGLSNREQELMLQIGSETATMHVFGGWSMPIQEKIQLVTLDYFVKERNLATVDFIKMDVDGHEPAVLDGAWDTLNHFKPLVLLEVNHSNYLECGVTAWDFYADLKKRGLFIYNDDTMEEITSREDFLIRCGNFAWSANILLSFTKLS